MNRLYQLKPLVCGSLFYLTFWGAIGIYLPFIYVYFGSSLGFTGRQIGWLAIFMPLMGVIFATPLSSLADRQRWRVRILMGATISLAVSLLMASIPRSFIVWVPMMIMITIAYSPIVPIADSLITRMATQHNLNYGSMRLWGSFSFAVMAIGCGFLWEQIGFDMMFIISGFAMLPVLLFAFMLDEKPSTPNPQATESLEFVRQDTGLLVLLFTSFLIGMSYYNSVVFDGIYMAYLGGTQSQIGLMFGIAAFSEIPLMQYSNILIKRIGGPKTLLIAYSLLGIAFFGYAHVWQPWMLLMMASMKGMGYGLFYVSSVWFISNRVPEDWGSTVQALFSVSAFGIAPLISSPIGGEIFDRFGPANIFLTDSLIIGVAVCTLSVAISRGVFVDAI